MYIINIYYILNSSNNRYYSCVKNIVSVSPGDSNNVGTELNFHSLRLYIKQSSSQLRHVFSAVLPQPLCEDEGRAAGGAEAAGGQDPTGRGATAGPEGEPGPGSGSGPGLGDVDGIWSFLRGRRP